jgi:hypothetical protein
MFGGEEANKIDLILMIDGCDGGHSLTGEADPATPPITSCMYICLPKQDFLHPVCDLPTTTTTTTTTTAAFAPRHDHCSSDNLAKYS